MVVGALLYILTALREARFLGAKMFFENLVWTPHSISLFLALDDYSSSFLIFSFRARLLRVLCFYSHVF
jgi:hypothetical protein